MRELGLLSSALVFVLKDFDVLLGSTTKACFICSIISSVCSTVRFVLHLQGHDVEEYEGVAGGAPAYVVVIRMLSNEPDVDKDASNDAKLVGNDATGVEEDMAKCVEEIAFSELRMLEGTKPELTDIRVV